MTHKCECNPFCEQLDKETRKVLCENVTITFQKAKQIQVVKLKDQLEIISQGVLLTFITSEDGSQKSIEIVKEGDLLGTHFLSQNIAYPEYQTMSLTDIKICHFPVKLIENLFRTDRQFAHVLLQYISERHARNSIFWMSMQMKNGKEKVEFVYDLLNDYQVDMSTVTQEDFALIAGVSRITVARAMKNIREKQ